MLHSIIIPHRNRNAELAACLASVISSARRCGVNFKSFEILVVDTQSDEAPERFDRTEIIHDDAPLEMVEVNGRKVPAYSKTRALNIGIEAARGQFLTFLDADSIVGRHFMRPVLPIVFATGVNGTIPKLTKLCYRVRLLPREKFDPYAPFNAQDHFKDYEHYPITAEFYGSPTGGKNWPTDPDPRLVFGNSQQTIPRKNLCNVRFNERYVGAGYEDIEFNRALARKWKSRYRAKMVTEPECSILQIQTIDRADDWWIPERATHNQRLYETT